MKVIGFGNSDIYPSLTQIRSSQSVLCIKNTSLSREKYCAWWPVHPAFRHSTTGAQADKGDFFVVLLLLFLPKSYPPSSYLNPHFSITISSFTPKEVKNVSFIVSHSYIETLDISFQTVFYICCLSYGVLLGW